MNLNRLTNSVTTDALELYARFAEQRHAILSDNLANVDTPGYLTQRVDVEAFEQALRESIDEATEAGAVEVTFGGSRQVSVDSAGSLRIEPSTEPGENMLFQDGTNVRLERLLSETNENALRYELATSLLRNKYESLLRSIRGRAT